MAFDPRGFPEERPQRPEPGRRPPRRRIVLPAARPRSPQNAILFTLLALAMLVIAVGSVALVAVHGEVAREARTR